MTAPGRRPTTIREWILDYCKRHGLEPPPDGDIEADEAGHVAPEPKLPPPHWTEREPGEDGE